MDVIGWGGLYPIVMDIHLLLGFGVLECNDKAFQITLEKLSVEVEVFE